MRRRTGPGSRRSASISFRILGRSVVQGQWSAYLGLDALTGHADPVRYRRLRHPSASTGMHQPGSSPVPIQAEQDPEEVVAPLRGRVESR